MMFQEKARSKAFWQQVRTDPRYSVFIHGLKEMYAKDACGELVDISYDDFMAYHLTGNRAAFMTKHDSRRRRLNACALLSLIYPEREDYFSNLNNTIWAICNEYCWSAPMHTKNSDLEYNDDYIDLCASTTGFELSEIRFLLGDRLSTLMNNRIHREIEKRIIHSFINHSYNWEKLQSNWPAVCAGNIAGTFLYEHPDLFDHIKPRIDAALGNFLASFKQDGVCREGLAYWEYGFGHFVCYALQLYETSRGQVDLFADEHIKNIARFASVPFLESGLAISFADCASTTRVSLSTITVLDDRYSGIYAGIPEKSCIYVNDNWKKCVRNIVLYDPERVRSGFGESEFYAPESGWFVKRTARYGFAAKGGDNAEPHNHNDVGHFIFSHNGRQVLVDLGSGEYVKGYFDYNGGRYHALCTRSGGHSVPILDGKEQSPGAEFSGITDYKDGRLIVDMIGAYPKTGVSRLIREFSFTENSVRLTDRYAFDKECGVVERLISLIQPQVKEGCISFGDVYIAYDAKLWNAKVTSAVHRKPDGTDQNAYLIDFEPKDIAVSVYCAEICVSSEDIP